ncbi:Zn-ribbon domain-containing OB-fold protein [Thermogladius sp. 4427co]|uniref:Zn-ribbon domain-containing OB-fold protein n=1 Tax=Thermogladius sp. 4427co TaxID=3450718 RepID=UPI003F7ADE4C
MRYSIPRFWRERLNYYRLKAAKCLDCGRVLYPYTSVCRVCGSRNVVEVELINEKARLLTYTVIYTAGEGFEQKRPVVIGIVETLESKARILARITDVDIEELKTGIILEPVLRRAGEDGETGLIHYLIMYRPVLEKAGS